jgi:hypothetical protein
MVMLNKFVVAAIAGMFAVGMAHAQASGSMAASGAAAAAGTTAAGGDCESQAIGKDGKALKGAAKSSFVKKCKADKMKSAKAGCETKAVGSNGKPLAGAAKASFMKKCEADAAK